MNRRFPVLLLIVLLVACFAAACSGPEPANNRQAPAVSSEPKAPAPSAGASSAPGATSQISTGTLQSVDLTARTFVIKNPAGNEETFEFSDTTEITGAAGTQALSGKQGGQVTVHHLTQPDGRHVATKIELTSN